MFQLNKMAIRYEFLKTAYIVWDTLMTVELQGVCCTHIGLIRLYNIFSK